jgi:transposase InsO family protein
LKSDLVYSHPWLTRAAARGAILDYIEGFYNPHHLHSTRGNLTPVAYENRHSLVAQSA